MKCLMKRMAMAAGFLLAVFALSGSLLADEAQWTDNFGKAKELAKEKKQPILALFTGSDWCPYCVRLESNFLSKKEFADYAAKKLVLFKADFPRYKKLQPGVAKQNAALADVYEVEGYPTLLLLNEKGGKIDQVDTRAENVADFVKSLDEIVAKAGKSK